MYDSRIGRWFATDKAQFKYPSLSPYNSFNNNPLIYKDIDGNDIFIVITRNDGTKSIVKYDRNMSEKGINKIAIETIHALNYLYDSKLLDVEHPGDKAKGCVDVLNYFLKPQNDLVIMPSSELENKALPSKNATDRFNRYGINSKKYSGSGSTNELDIRNTGYVEFDPKSGIIFSTDKSVTVQYLEKFKSKINLDGINSLSYYSSKFKIGFHSPILQLAHEFFHVYNLFEDPKFDERHNDIGGPGSVMGIKLKNHFFDLKYFKTAEEQFVIQKLMTQVNQQVGAPNPNDHLGNEVITDSPTSVATPQSPDENKGG